MSKRTAKIQRDTKETQISCEVNIDGIGESEIETGIGFLDHMLDSFSRHSLIDLKLNAKGDLHVDQHHTVEDTGIVIGLAIADALGGFSGIKRFGNIPLIISGILLNFICILSVFLLYFFFILFVCYSYFICI